MSQHAGAGSKAPLPRARLAATLVVVAAAAALVPLARALPGGADPFLPLAGYLPARSGERLSYRLSGSIRAAVTLEATSRRIAGVPTLSLERRGASPGAAVLPFGLSGGTVRIEGGGVVRTAEGGTVRDLVGPPQPGQRWSDSRHVAAAGGAGTTFTVAETRTLLGPASLDEPAGHFDRCAVVEVASRASSAGGPVAAAAATLWYCEGVGLARAVLRGGNGSGDVIDLVDTG
jgi:hypothetical protein